MAISPALSLPIVEHWQVFEDLCCDLWSHLWNDPNTQKNGRHGQAQKGVDIYGRPDQGNEWAGVQCKHKEQLVRSKLTRKEIEAEVREARALTPPLSRLVIATTSPRDAVLQKAVREIDDTERKAGSFSVTVFFWQDIVSRLGDFPKLLQKYYSCFFFQPQPEQPEEVREHGKSVSGLEVELKLDDELDYFALLPAYSSVKSTRSPDLTVLTAYLSHIEVINPDSLPTEIQRVWLSIEDPVTKREVPPREIEEVILKGNPKIGIRGHQGYDLSFKAVYDGAPQKDWRQRVILHVKAIGLGERQIRLEEAFPKKRGPAGRRPRKRQSS